MSKQVTAAGFQLKGSGWYATDFRNPPAANADAKDKIEKDSGAKDDAARADKPADKSVSDSDSSAKEKVSSTAANDVTSSAGEKAGTSPAPTRPPAPPPAAS